MFGSIPSRVAKWKDFYRQFVGPEAIVPVAIAADLRSISTREVGAFQTFSVVSGNPTATQHWVYTFTPANASRGITLRLVYMKLRTETSTTLVGFRTGTATAKAATNAIFPIGDPNVAVGGAWTRDEITAANLPITLYTTFPDAFGVNTFEPLGYPEYFLETFIDAGQVFEIVCRTPDDGLDVMLGYYTQPIV